MTGAGLLVLRAAVGLTFLLHGIAKLRDQDGTRSFFASLGIPAPGANARMVTVVEAGGGVLLLAGLATRFAAAALAADMLVAYLTAHRGKGFFVEKGGWELVLLLGGACAALALTGSGNLGVDAALT